MRTPNDRILLPEAQRPKIAATVKAINYKPILTAFMRLRSELAGARHICCTAGGLRKTE
jgi:hypothetical protein